MVTQSVVLYPAKIGANRLHFREAMDAQTRLASGASRAGMGRVVAFDLYQGTTLHAAESRISQRLVELAFRPAFSINPVGSRL